MPLEKAQCPNCGGALEVDSSKEAAICPFCNTPYIVEKAINNYVTNVTNNIKANTVIINGKNDTDFEIDRTTLVKYKGHEKNVIIPPYIEVIGRDAFRYCSYIETVQIPDGVIEIGDSAFWSCKGLQTISLPDSVREIGGSAFYACENLKSVSLSNSLTPVDGFAFSGLTSIVIPEGVKRIGSYAFRGCKNLSSITFPDSLTSIGEKAFDGCYALTQVINLHTDRVEIGENAFAGTNFAHLSPAPKSSGGCYVATAVYGSYNCPQVWTLRRFRDNNLAKTYVGRLFVRFYYAVSPTIVKWFGNTKLFSTFWKRILDPMVKRLNAKGVADTPYQDREW